jgi:hypothetical protein
LYLLVLTNLAVLMLFFVRDRFRAPLTASLIPLAALTIVLAAQRLQQRRWKNAAMIAGGVVLLALFTAWPLPPETPLIRPVDCFLPYQLYYDPMEQQARHSGDYQKAAEILADSLNFQPEIVKRLALDHPARSNCAAVMGRAYADVYYRSAKDYHLAGRAQDAARQRARADELNFACRAYPR